MNIAEKIADALVEHDVDLLRVEQAHLREMLARFDRLAGEVVEAIKRIDVTEPTRRGDQLRRLERLQDDINARIDAVYVALARRSENDLTETAVAEHAAVVEVTGATLGFPLLKARLALRAARELVKRLRVPADDSGAEVAQLWRTQRDGLKTRLASSLRRSVDTARTLTDTLRAIRGNKAIRYRDGILPKTRAQVEALVRTAQQQTVNAARWSAYERNKDTVKGVQAQAVLDGRTSITCRVRNGRAWLMDGKPFRQYLGRVPTSEPFPGPPPWHWRCRSTLVPIFFDVEALQSVVEPSLHKQIVELDGQFSFDGKPGLVQTFDAWLGKRGPTEAARILGKGRYELYADGKIGLSDLLNQQGREMSLRDLRAKLNITEE